MFRYEFVDCPVAWPYRSSFSCRILEAKEIAVGKTGSPWNRDKQGHLLQDLAIQEIGEVGRCTQNAVLSQKSNFALLLFLLFSIFYVWLSVGGSEWEEGEGRPLEKDSRFENTAENLGAYRLTFSSILS